MKKVISALVSLLLAFTVHAQTAYPLFQPSNGIMVGDVNTYVTTSATGPDVVSLFSGTCNGAAFLRGDASCFDLLGNANTWTGAQTWTANMALSKADPRFCQYDSGSDATWFWRMSSDVLRLNIVDSTVCTTTGASAPIAITSAGGTASAISLTSTALTWNGNPLSTAVGANPTATLGLTAINGVATTFMRSDAAPALSQAIVPTWTGTHMFQGSAPRIRYNATGAPVDEKQWAIQIFSTGTFSLNTRTDADGTGSDAITISRTGTAINTTAFNAATFQVNASTASNFSNSSSTNTFAGPVAANNATAITIGATDGEIRKTVDTNRLLLLGGSANNLANGARVSLFGTSAGGTPGNIDLAPGTGGLVTVPGATRITTLAGTAANPNLQITSASPNLGLFENDATANNGLWIERPVAEQLRLSACNDAGSVCTDYMLVDRTTTTVDSIALNATAVTVNGQNVCRADGTGCPAGAVPAAPNQSLQFNNSGAFGGDADLLWDSAANTLTLASGSVIQPTSGGGLTVGQSAGNSSLTLRAAGASNLLLQTNGSTRLTIETDGSWNVAGSNGTASQVLTSNGSSSSPTWQSLSALMRRAFGQFNVSGSSCTLTLSANQNISSCTRNSAGNYTVITSLTGGNTISCVVSAADNTAAAFASVLGNNDTDAIVQMRNSAGTAADIAFSVNCSDT